jgi:hypothetical protein
MTKVSNGTLCCNDGRIICPTEASVVVVVLVRQNEPHEQQIVGHGFSETWDTIVGRRVVWKQQLAIFKASSDITHARLLV